MEVRWRIRMGKYDFSDLNQIMEQVQKAIESVDYKKLNEEISGTIGTAMNEVKKSWKTFQNNAKKEEEVKIYEYKEYKEVDSFSKEEGESQPSYPVSIPAKNVGRVAGILMTVFGSIGLFSFALPLLICSIMWMAGAMIDREYAVTAAVLIPFLIASVVVFTRGIYLDIRSSRFKKYMRRIGNKTVCSIEDLSRTTEKSTKYVIKDLRRMINIGMFPEAHMDEEEKCLILDHKTYEYYLESKHQLERHLREEERMEQEEANNPRSKELRLVIETGKNYVNQIRQVNDELPDPEISEKLDHMEKIISQIFTCVELHPDKLPEITKFLDYYMPTTLKLVQAYKNLEKEPIQTENIISSKREIRQILDTINEAFRNLMDSLYDDMAMDISADISVLKTMLAQEGLTGNDFGKKE